MEYNECGGNGHRCTGNEYVDFCCSRIYKGSELFRTYKNCLQIQIYQDDFEVCVPIGSKATIHKMCGVYFAIRNWPNSSRLDHIYLVALCNVDDLKTPSTDFNNIWRLIVKEIKVLETQGLDVSDTINLRGTLATVCADNAGANTSLGFAGSFSASHYCRICELPKQMCEITSNEQSLELRTIQKYENRLQIIEKSSKVDYAMTKGIRMDCDLNKLDNFHVVENYCIDIMHDLAEGVVPFFLKHLFNYCIQSRIFTEKSIIAKIQYFDFGVLNKKNIPSNLMLSKDNLNQNAAQSICLFRHIPFILRNFENQLMDVWECMISLQKILQILYTQKITEQDLTTLNAAIVNHLNDIRRLFRVKLLPKHHNLTHYVSVIRAIGPLRIHSTIRFEAKHQQFKQFAKNNKNFKDLTKTLAFKHQNQIRRAVRNFDIVEKVSFSGKETYNGDLAGRYGMDHQLKYVLIDDRKFERGLFILHDYFVFEIVLVLKKDGDSNCLLYCKKYEIRQFNEFLCSYNIEEFVPQVFTVVHYEQFKSYELYEKSVIGRDFFIFAKNLEIQRLFEL